MFVVSVSKSSTEWSVRFKWCLIVSLLYPKMIHCFNRVEENCIRASYKDGEAEDEKSGTN